MCGIIGYVGNEPAENKLLTGLKALEYRGYDSCGIATKEKTTKTRGRVAFLQDLLKNSSDSATIGIGHTRWATHGEASDVNAHPHTVGKITLVHNGIIENYNEIKEELSTQGVDFVSQTDTEVACALINHYYEAEKDIVKSILKAKDKLVGSYAFAIMVENEGDKIYAIRYKSPLIVAKGKDGYYLASDMSALIHFTRKYYRLNEGEVVELSRDNIALYNAKISTPKWEISNLSVEDTRKQGYDHYMLKEIYEQSEVVKNTLAKRIKNGVPSFSEDGLSESYFKDIKEIHIIGCGSAMHAGLVGKGLIEKYARVPTTVFVASEYRYSPPIKSDNTLCIFISQSGETADTLASLDYAKNNGYKTLSIVNAQDTSIAIEAHNVIYTYAGVEIAVATTKGYTTQLAVLSLIALKLALDRNTLSYNEVKDLTEKLYNNVPEAIENVLSKRSEIKKIAEKISTKNDAFYIGRGLDYYLCKEGSLKLKEISYINSQDYPAGELKHGTISLITENTPVIAIATNKELFSKTVSNLKEVKSRGAFAILITSLTENDDSADKIIYLNVDSEIEATFASIISTQLLSYEVAFLRGCDIDKPRNLAKSVTVE
ncbi:MAG: glutamine--fructose-6-phosphate transaminase (isomerizing) [Clostridia bacterium]|nr:glutamine--fructose-6-phosphate transaminase (isomerizing) [Clostridia bacterium]